MTASLAIIIVTYNSAEALPGLLETLPAGLDGIRRAEIVVVDNASADGSAELAEAHPMRPRVVRTGRNGGYAAGINAGAGLATYRAAKAAVIHLTRSIAVDLAQYDIRVNAVAPGFIKTDMTSYDMDAVTRFTQPLRRRGRTADVAEAVLYRASDRSAQITGVVLPVDGGTTAGPPAS